MIIKLITKDCIDDKIDQFIQDNPEIDFKVICKVEIESGFGYYFEADERYEPKLNEYLSQNFQKAENREMLTEY